MKTDPNLHYCHAKPAPIRATPAELMAMTAAVNPAAIVMMAQMLGVDPCTICDFVRPHCKCEEGK